MSSTSKQSEDDLLAEEVGDEGEEDKKPLTDERNAVLPRASQQLKNQTVSSSEELNWENPQRRGIYNFIKHNKSSQKASCQLFE